MNLFTLEQQITETWDERWHLLADGPQFHYNLGTVGNVASVFGYHSWRAVLNEDVDIAIEFGLNDDPSNDDGNWTAPWAPFPDESVHGRYADVFYRGALVDRELLASVDGGRAVLPIPSRQGKKWVASHWEHELARLVDELNGHSEFVDYFTRSGMEKIPA